MIPMHHSWTICSLWTLGCSLTARHSFAHHTGVCVLSLFDLFSRTRQASLEKNIFLQTALWPDFGADDTVCKLNAVSVKTVQYTAVTATSSAT